MVEPLINFIMEETMTKLNKLLLIFLALAFSAVVTFGGGQNRAGTAAAAQLRIPIGARYLGVGGSQIANVSGLDAIFWNPSGVDFNTNAANGMFSHRTYIADMNLNYVAVNGKFGDFGSLGFSFKYLNIGEINVTTMDQPDGTGQVLKPNFFVVGLTYSKTLTDRIAIGLNFNIINEGFGRIEASGFSFDVGLQYRDLFDTKGLDLGIVYKNLGGSMQYEGNATYVQADDPTSSRGPTFYQISVAENPLPSELSIGLSYKAHFDEVNAITLSSAYFNNNYTFDDYKFGLEYSYNDMFFLRGGYLFSPQSTTETPNIFQNYTLGAGFNFKEITGLDLSVDYAFIPVDYFDSNHVFSLNVGF